MSHKRDSGDFRNEIESHLDHEADRLAAERRLTAEDARSAAQRVFGNVTSAQERFHESRRWVWLENLRRNMGYAFRTMRHHPAFSVGTIITLACGIGVNVALFSVFSGMVLRPFPVPDASRLVNIYQELSGKFQRNVSGMASLVSYEEYQQFQAAGRSFTSLAAYAPRQFTTPLKDNGEFQADMVSCNYFATVGVKIETGRGFLTDECTHAGNEPVAVLSYSSWQKLYGSDPDILGKALVLNQVPLTIVGVAQPGYAGLGLKPAEAWVPVTMYTPLRHGQDSVFYQDWSWLFLVGRLAPGASAGRARTELMTVAARRDADRPGRHARISVTEGAFFNFPEARSMGFAVVIAIGILGFIVIAMTSANIMNLLLARGVARRREVGIRLAVGASRGTLIMQLLTESIVLSSIGGTLGFVLAFALPAILRSVVPIELQLDLSPDWRVLIFATGASLVTALTFGLLPAVHATRVDLVSAFKGVVTIGTKQVETSRLRNAIVGVQVGGSAFLLVIAGLFLRGADRAANADPGYVTTNVILFAPNLRQLGYEPGRARAAADALFERVRSAPAVRDVAFGEGLPLLSRHGETFRVVDQDPQGPVDINPSVKTVEPAYFTALSIKLLAGRIFTDEEARGGGRFAVVSESFAKQIFPTTNAIGKRFESSRPDKTVFTITGVVGDIKAYTLTDDREQFAYFSATPEDHGGLDIIVRTSGDLGDLERSVPGWAREVDPALRVVSERFSDRFAIALKPPRIASAVAGTMGLLTMILALVGVYGVVSYAVSQRTREIAVRLALGATGARVIALMMRQGRKPVVIGALVGVLAAAGATQLIRNLLFGVSPLDPIAYIAAAIVLVAAAMLALYLPARRVASIDPAGTLRQE